MKHLGLLGLCLLFAVPAHAVRDRRSLKPRWSVRLPWSAESARAIGDTVLLSADSGAHLAAFRGSDGHELWRRSSGAIPAVPAGADALSAYYTVAGANPSGGVTLLKVLRQHFVSDPRNGGGSALERTEVIQGVETRTGRVLWEQRGEARVNVLYGEWSDPLDIAATLGNVVALQSGNGSITLRDMRSGRVLTPPKDGEALVRAAGAGPSPRLVIRPHHDLQALSLANGAARTISGVADDMISNVVVGNRLVVNIDSDWGGLGGTSAPKYLAGYDFSGKRLWQFPVRHMYLDGGFMSTGPSRIEKMQLVSGAGVVIGENGTQLYGVRVRDGKALWQQVHLTTWYRIVVDGPVVWLLTAPKRRGRRESGFDSVARLDASTGRLNWTGRVPSGSVLAAGGGELFVAADRLYAYPVQAPPFRLRRRPPR